MLRMRDLPLTEAVYTFVEHGGTAAHIPAATHIAASSLLAALERHGAPVTRCMIAPSLVEALERGDLGVEPPHALRLPEAALERPGVIGEWGEAHIAIDGAHRLWRRWQRGDADFPAYVVPEPLWRAFMIADMPGSGTYWDNFNRTAQIRTPELERLLRLLGGK